MKSFFSDIFDTFCHLFLSKSLYYLVKYPNFSKTLFSKEKNLVIKKAGSLTKLTVRKQ